MLAAAVVVDDATGVKAALRRVLQPLVARERAAAPPGERRTLYLLLAWLHATVASARSRPSALRSAHAFSGADAQCSLAVVDHWLGVATSGGGARAHVAPESVPWDALRAMLTESTYGGQWVGAQFGGEAEAPILSAGTALTCGWLTGARS